MNNYYSRQSDIDYASCSQLDKFDQCEATYKAYLNGEYNYEKTESLLLGSYVHSWAEGKLEEFKQDNPEIFTKNGVLKCNFRKANKMIDVLSKDPLCMEMLKGESELVFHGEINGMPWKIRVDKFYEKRVVDLKTTKDIYEKTWKDGQKVNFIENYNYQRRAAIYSEIIRQNLGFLPEFYLVVVSKEVVPNKEIIDMTDVERWKEELNQLKTKRFKLLREQKIDALRCERCDYCKSTKMLKKSINYKEI